MIDRQTQLYTFSGVVTHINERERNSGDEEGLVP